MWAFAKATLLVARYFRRIAKELESIRQLYELDLASRGIVRIDPKLHDEVEMMYGPLHSQDEAGWEKEQEW